MSDDRAVIYKILPRAMWDEAVAKGAFEGAPVDLADGFMHFSTATQCAKTLELYFAGQKDLVRLAIETATLEAACAGKEGAKLQWDHSKSRNEDFPHLYGMPLPVAAVKVVEPIPDER